MSRPLTVFFPVAFDELESLVDAFTGDPGDWLPEAGAVSEDRWEIEVRLGPFRREVICRVGDPQTSGPTICRELAWWPPGHDEDRRSLDDVLPRFEGELIVHPGRLVLALDGAYDVPGGRLGELADAAALGVLARRTGSALLADIAGHGDRKPDRNGVDPSGASVRSGRAT